MTKVQLESLGKKSVSFPAMIVSFVLLYLFLTLLLRKYDVKVIKTCFIFSVRVKKARMALEVLMEIQ